MSKETNTATEPKVKKPRAPRTPVAHFVMVKAVGANGESIDAANISIVGVTRKAEEVLAQKETDPTIVYKTVHI